uniref:Uncharacterized protein n=1 Tax=Anguilla anguilla TaxID=7936 RepID=A0A0E9VTR1_ANGAN
MIYLIGNKSNKFKTNCFFSSFTH